MTVKIKTLAYFLGKAIVVCEESPQQQVGDLLKYLYCSQKKVTWLQVHRNTWTGHCVLGSVHKTWLHND